MKPIEHVLPSEAEETIKSIKDWVLDKIDSFAGEPMTLNTSFRLQEAIMTFENKLKQSGLADLLSSYNEHDLIAQVRTEIEQCRRQLRTMFYKVCCSTYHYTQFKEECKEQAIEAYKLWTGKEPGNDGTDNTTKLS